MILVTVVTGGCSGAVAFVIVVCLVNLIMGWVL